MERRDYFSKRTGKISETPEITLKVLKKLFMIVYVQLEEEGYFQKYFGYYCVDQDEVRGELGYDIDSQIFLAVRKEGLWPIKNKIDDYSEDDTFDIIEFIYDHCSKPLEGDFHRHNGCGWHYSTFDDIEGRKLYREKLNKILADYKEGFEISKAGEILEFPEKNLASLLEAKIPSTDNENINKRIDLAVTKFRKHKSSIEDRNDAIRQLVDVLEYLRPQMKNIMGRKDDSDLFNIANNFGIRHHNSKQKVDYDKPIWYSWMFYFYLATIHTVLRLIEKNKKSSL